MKITKRASATVRCVPVAILVLLLLVVALLSSSEALIQIGYLGRLSAPANSSSWWACSDVSVSAAYASVLRIQHCQGRSGRAGAFVITHKGELFAQLEARQRTASPKYYLPKELLSECNGKPVYRVRITGPEIFYAEIVEQRPPEIVRAGDHARVYAAEYKLMFPRRNLVTYHAEILQLYANFSYCDMSRLNADMFVASHRWQVGASGDVFRGGGASATTTDANDVPCNKGSGSTGVSQGCLGMCSASNGGKSALPGRWVADTLSYPGIARLVDELNRTRLFEHVAEVRTQPAGPESVITMQKARSSHELRWQPVSGCSIDPSLPEIAWAWRRVCGGRNADRFMVCFVGDSQTRHIYGMANAILDDVPSPIPAHRNKSVPASTWSRYARMDFGHEIEESYTGSSNPNAAAPVDLSNCTHLVMNFGQWPLGWPAGSRPWTVQAIQARVDKVMATLKRRWPRLPSSMFWLSTHPHGLLLDRMGNVTHPPLEWRVDPYIQQQNAAMQAYFSQLAIPYIDTFDVLNPFADFAYDGAHYLGTPGYWAAALVLNSVCR
jgi:hypothetical protein